MKLPKFKYPILILLLLSFLITGLNFSATFAAEDNNKKPSSISSKTTPSAKNSGVAKLTGVRWAIHKDAATGTESIRVVVEASAPVTAKATLSNSPKPQLIVTVENAVPYKLKTSITMDKKIVNKLAISVKNKNITQVVFDLPSQLGNDEYKVFTLKKDDVTKKPFRVVVDIDKATPMPDFSYTAGLKNKIIVIDAGHGGSDPGAIGSGKTQEKNVTLAVAKNLKVALEKEGVKVYLTRERDVDVHSKNATATEELKARTTIANSRKADVFISIHNDSFTNNEVGGTSTFYHKKTLYDPMLASAIQKNLLKQTGLNDRRANESNFYVVKNTKMPAILIELAFISNPKEEKLLNSAQFQSKVSNGIITGLKEFFESASKIRGENNAK